MKRFLGFEKGMGIGGWLTNYKRFNVLPNDIRMHITVGDMEHFESYITKRDVEYIASLGFDHIRLGFDQIVLEDAPYHYRERIFELIREFVKNCRSCGLNVVLNLHKSIGNYCDIQEEVTLFDSEELQDRFVALWLEFEKRFAEYPEVAFELLNEVRDIDPKLWNDLAKKAVKALREVNQERKIIVGSISWNSCHELDKLVLFDDENIIYTFHMYEPFEFTHQQGVLQWRTLYYNRKMTYPCEDIERYREYQRLHDPDSQTYMDLERMDIQFMRKHLQPAFDFVKAHPDKILWCGEFGTIRHADIASRENWMKDMITLLKEHEIPYCVWNYLSTPNDGNRFSLVDDDRREILSERLHKILIGEV